ncbi:adenosine deaminase [Streptomyces albiflavescens]|uniref:adenosine deaminase n=2 Tax=Streptomyces albiflavescens TaxID=1623582 RepID=A0A917XVB6_9ACTN|nr:adenosine deaminase [Streptomyces albiflavescens]GGN55339.1 adenosine deaminase [Streptomyces albiflavescens]
MPPSALSPARRRTARLAPVLSAALALALTPTQLSQAAGKEPNGPTHAEARVSAYLRDVRDRPEALAAFFRALPKGADLHNHLSGAATTELLLRIAVEAGYCIDTTTLTAGAPPCTGNTRPAADTVTDPAFRRQVIRAWSMQDFTPGQGESSHDHFFATFGKFGAVTGLHPGRLLAQVATSAAQQHQFYLETMWTPAWSAAAALAAKVGYDSDLARLREKMLADGGMDAVVQQAMSETDSLIEEFRAAAHCDTDHPDAGCALPVRFIAQVDRGGPPELVFAQMLLGVELARRDPRFVSLNLVGPEEDPVAVADYRLHMRMLNYLRGVYPAVPLTLHAGELVPGLVKPEDLRFHVRDAVLTARTDRVGHGVDIRHEDDYPELLRLMARQHVLVEVPLTSNAQVLGVTGPAHPFPLFRRYGVPVALATDDQGVERTDISREYERAALTYQLDYRVLKDLARTSLEYGFLKGRSLWRDRDGFQVVPECAGDRLGDPTPSRRCALLLASSAKGTVEWKQEDAFRAFERTFGAGAPRTGSRTAGALVGSAR